jgi:hypothetical protein
MVLVLVLVRAQAYLLLLAQVQGFREGTEQPPPSCYWWR